MNDAIRVAVVDDHPLVRAGLRAVLDATAGIEVVGEADSGEAAVALAAAERPDVVLMDLSMPGLGGIEATRRVRAAGSTTVVVVLSSFSGQDQVRDALAAGAVGYLLKDSPPETVIEAIHSAYAGHAPLDPRVARVLLPLPATQAPPATQPPLAAPASPGARAGTPAPPDVLDEVRQAPGPPEESRLGPGGHPGGLSDREVEVLLLLTRGLANKQIGHRLGISERTVKAHLSSIFRRLGVRDRTAAALWAREHGVA